VENKRNPWKLITTGGVELLAALIVVLAASTSGVELGNSIRWSTGELLGGETRP